MRQIYVRLFFGVAVLLTVHCGALGAATLSVPVQFSTIQAAINAAQTGDVIEYLMPTELDTKKIAFDPTSDRISLLMANMRTARILRVEVLD